MNFEDTLMNFEDFEDVCIEIGALYVISQVFQKIIHIKIVDFHTFVIICLLDCVN